MEPIRRILGTKGAYYEAECQEINPEEKTIVACFPKDAGFPAACFKVPYDYLVVGEVKGEAMRVVACVTLLGGVDERAWAR